MGSFSRYLICVVVMQCISLIDLQEWCFELGIVMMGWFYYSVERIHLKWWSRLAVWKASMWDAFPLLKVIHLSLRYFGDSDWILKIWNADSHYLFPSKSFAEPQMMPEWAPWVDVVVGEWFGETRERTAQQSSPLERRSWRAWEMSIRERGMKWVLPLIVTSSVFLNAPGRYTLVRFGMSKHHS